MYYGNLREPTDWGSRSHSTYGGEDFYADGGGVIKLICSGTATIDGTLSPHAQHWLFLCVFCVNDYYTYKGKIHQIPVFIQIVQSCEVYALVLVTTLCQAQYMYTLTEFVYECNWHTCNLCSYLRFVYRNYLQQRTRRRGLHRRPRKR